MTSRIIGTGSSLPKSVVTNDFLSTIMDTSDEWISSRTGIRERHLVQDETTASLSIEAAKAALAEAGVEPEELDMIVVGTLTGDYVTPSTACEVQAGLGAVNAVAFDINAACAGFIFGLHTVNAYIRSGMCRLALVIGAESLSRIMDWTDRSTCVLFGDGAGAAVIRAQETGLVAYDQGSDGKKGKYLACQNRTNNNPLIQTDKILAYTQMDGQEVYKFAVSYVPASIQKVLDEAGLSPEDVKYYLLHQANLRIIQSVAKRLKLSLDKFPISLDHCGNVSAASVPILLDEVNRKGMLQKGDKIIMSGFGGGLTWGTCLLEW
ncbi:MAG: ketoacyl-ACP synthase III [Lachnospiraceae bacterium]|nr:ketoacyl-ACP synthase III [Lachnospiraceae bacterium]